jgi:hypothetical protein
MTPIDDDVLDDALSAVALRKAAKQGELAAQTLLVFADGRESELVTFLSNMLRRPVDVADPARIRQMAAYFMSQDALNAPSKKARKAARRYLENNDVAPSGAVRSLGFLPVDGALIDIAEALARKALIGIPGGELPPVWLLQRDGEDTARIIESPWENDLVKLAILDDMRRLMGENSVSAYAFVSEAWIAGPDTDVQPRDSDTRVEIVHAVVADGKSKTSKVWSIIRNDDGVCVELKFWAQSHGVSGPIAEFLVER